MDKITVIGAGTMGNGIAHHFSLFNYSVSLIDIDDSRLDNAKNVILQNMDRQVKKGVIQPRDKSKAFENITFSKSIEDAEDSLLIIEAITENIQLKKEILKGLGSFIKKGSFVASNTSSISITELSSVLKTPSRFIGMHFMNPVPIMPLVEVINGYNTSSETTEAIKAIVLDLGKTPVIVNDYPGFVSNRILMPLINEAIQTLFEGVAGVEEIDNVMKLGMSHPMGPLQLADFIGLDVCLSIMEVLYKGFGNPKYAPCPLLVNMVSAGKLGKKSSHGFYDYSNSSKELVVSHQFLK